MLKVEKDQELEVRPLARAIPKPLSKETTERVRAITESMLGVDSERILNRATRGQALRDRIQGHLRGGQRLKVTLTDNTYTMISVKRMSSRATYELRLHHMFYDAPESIIVALARYVEDNDKDSSALLGDYIDANQTKVRPRKRQRAVNLETKGECHDLAEIYDELNRNYFGGGISASVTWGSKRSQTKRRRSIKMGSYSPDEKLIRIHRSLDRAFVPRYFVAWVLYHEMLHQIHPVRVKGGRRLVHPPEFLADERKFKQYEQAVAWQKKYIVHLLSY